MSLVGGQTRTGWTWTARPNHSLTVAGRRCVFVAMTVGSGAIAAVFSYFGAWPIAPFTGLELALLWFALRHSELAAADYETITLESGQLVVDRHYGKQAERVVFQSYWLALDWVKGPGRSSYRLLLRSRGKAVEIGRLLTDEQKNTLAAELRRGLADGQCGGDNRGGRLD